MCIVRDVMQIQHNANLKLVHRHLLLQANITSKLMNQQFCEHPTIGFSCATSHRLDIHAVRAHKYRLATVYVGALPRARTRKCDRPQSQDHVLEPLVAYHLTASLLFFYDEGTENANGEQHDRLQRELGTVNVLMNKFHNSNDGRNATNDTME